MLLPFAGCLVDVPLSGKACAEGHECVDGYLCQAGICVAEGSAAELDAGPAARDSGTVDAGSDSGPSDSGPSDSGSADSGTVDAGASDSGIVDASEPLPDASAEDAGENAISDSGPDADGGHDAGFDAGEESPFGSGRDGALEVSSSLALNTCRPLLSSDDTSVTLTTAAGIEAGMLVLLWQVQDTFATVADQAEVSAPGSAGLFEIVRVSQRQGGRLSTNPPPSRSYRSDDGSVAQACSLPEHTTVTIQSGGALRAEPWNGSVGGVIALLASESVTVEASGVIDASGRGFRGGLTDPGTNDVGGITLEITDREQGGQKGEGLDPTAMGLYGRGNFANGAGGGNAHNGGGGGGGNGGRGGGGGIEWVDSNVPNTGGRGGVNVSATERLVLGGGGGAAEMHHTAGTDGGNGGGLVLLVTPALVGAGTLRANGASALDIEEAGSGGGAGGSVIVLAPDVSSFSGAVEARGGNGANATAGLGPGGGGGGGVVRGAGLANVDVSGGVNGTAEGEARGAEPGADGLVLPP